VSHDEHDHGHDHHPEPLAPVEARVAAIESVLIEHGMFDTELLDGIVENFEHNLGPLNGAKVVARAWTDPGYKAPAYRSRAVREPRALLAEMGTPIPEDVEIRVWDSSAEVRYLVLPERPDGTDGLSEDELVTRVTRDSMIGVARL